MIVSFGMALRYSFGMGKEADLIDAAIAAALAKGAAHGGHQVGGVQGRKYQRDGGGDPWRDGPSCGTLGQPLGSRNARATMVVATTDNDVKERLSIAYVTAVAARAGCQLTEVHVDRNRIDATISAISGTRVKIDVQLKATSANILDSNYVVFDLDVAAYDALRSIQVQSAQLLVVLVLPDDPVNWLTVDEASLVLKKCCYWKNLYGEPPVQNTRTVRVRLPRSQIFGPNELRDLMRDADAKARSGQTGI